MLVRGRRQMCYNFFCALIFANAVYNDGCFSAKLCVVRWQQPAVPHMRCELQTRAWAPVPMPVTTGHLRRHWRYCSTKGTASWFWEQHWCAPNGAVPRPLKTTGDLLRTVLWEVRLWTEVKNKRTGVCTYSYLHLLYMKGHCMLCW